MDPNANLREQRELVQSIHALIDGCNEDGTMTRESEESLMHDASRLAELVEALDTWIMRGGFIPDDWKAFERAIPCKVNSRSNKT